LASGNSPASEDLRFVVKNPYNAFASTSKYEVGGRNCIEPYREHYFTAVFDDEQQENNIVYNSIMADGIYKELKELGDRGRDNKKQLADRVRDTKNFFNKAIKAESEDAEYKYEVRIDEERSDELTALALRTKATRARS
jgi:hypothetical protein